MKVGISASSFCCTEVIDDESSTITRMSTARAIALGTSLVTRWFAAWGPLGSQASKTNNDRPAAITETTVENDRACLRERDMGDLLGGRWSGLDGRGRRATAT